MQFITLLKSIDMAERVLPELVSDWIYTKNVQNIDVGLVQMLCVYIVISFVF